MRSFQYRILAILAATIVTVVTLLALVGRVGWDLVGQDNLANNILAITMTISAATMLYNIVAAWEENR